VAVLLEKGLIGEFGEIISGETEIALDSRVSLTQKDIQEFQLAKAAIAAGIEILITRLCISHEEVEEVYIAGGFGSYINLINVIQLGMMDFRQERIHKLGNTALMGAKMFLFEHTNYPDLILKICSHISLESEPGFQDIFVDKLAFILR